MTLLGELETFIFVSALLANVGLALAVLRSSTPSIYRTLFIFFVAAQVLWISANYLSFNLAPGKFFLWTSRATLFFASFHVLFLFLFVFSFLEEKNVLKQKLLFLLYVLFAVAAFLTLTPFVFSAFKTGTNGEPLPEVGPAMPVFGIFVILSLLLTIYTFLKKYRQASGIARLQWRFLATGLILTFALVIAFSFFNFVFFDNAATVRFGHIYTIPFLLFTTYAIVRHRLFNIRIIATELFTAIIIFTSLINLLSSENSSRFAINFIVFFLIVIFGVLLVRGTIREIRELQRLSQAKSDFVSLVSHQLRTPLTAIKGFVSMIMEGSGTEEERKDWLKKTYLTNERLIRLVSDILNMSRIEEGRIKYDFKPIDIAGLIDSVISETSYAAKDKGLNLLWQGPDIKIPPINADELKLRQVILNLVDNAIKYTEKGWVSVRLLHYKDLERIRIIVQDTGFGMSQEDLANLFGRFTRGKEGKKSNTEGMGIGLYVARHIVNAHQGKIWAESEGPGTGSKFYVELPVIA